jgi:hypothetical protein
MINEIRELSGLTPINEAKNIIRGGFVIPDAVVNEIANIASKCIKENLSNYEMRQNSRTMRFVGILLREKLKGFKDKLKIIIGKYTEHDNAEAEVLYDQNTETVIMKMNFGYVNTEVVRHELSHCLDEVLYTNFIKKNAGNTKKIERFIEKRDRQVENDDADIGWIYYRLRPGEITAQLPDMAKWFIDRIPNDKKLNSKIFTISNVSRSIASTMNPGDIGHTKQAVGLFIKYFDENQERFEKILRQLYKLVEKERNIMLDRIKRIRDNENRSGVKNGSSR